MTPRLLLDTHVWLWLLTDSSRLPAALRDEISGAATQRYLSAASAWEIGIKYMLGKLPLPMEPREYVPSRVRATGMTLVDITAGHALSAGALPPHHQDPVDRLIVAQALAEGMTIVTADRKIARYDVPVRIVG